MRNPISNNFAPAARSNERMQLPAGLYIGRITGVKEKDNAVIIRVDIAEGEFAGFYKRDYDAQTGGQFEPKYHGDFRMSNPDGRDSRIDDIRTRTINESVYCVEQSNKGFRWQWETIENDAKGKLVGLNVREREWIMEDRGTPGEYRHGTSTEIGRLEVVDEIRNGKVKPMKKRELSEKDKMKLGGEQEEVKQPALVPVEVSDNDIPF